MSIPSIRYLDKADLLPYYSLIQTVKDLKKALGLVNVLEEKHLEIAYLLLG